MKRIVSDRSPGVTVSPVGADGIVLGVATTVLEAEPPPARFTARTRTRYEVPFASPVIVPESAREPTRDATNVDQAPLFSEYSYPLIAESPVRVGGFQVSTNWPLPGVARTLVGAPGTTTDGGNVVVVVVELVVELLVELVELVDELLVLDELLGGTDDEVLLDDEVVLDDVVELLDVVGVDAPVNTAVTSRAWLVSTVHVVAEPAPEHTPIHFTNDWPADAVAVSVMVDPEPGMATEQPLVHEMPAGELLTVPAPTTDTSMRCRPSRRV